LKKRTTVGRFCRVRRARKRLERCARGRRKNEISVNGMRIT
jgi:hypothetical protein